MKISEKDVAQLAYQSRLELAEEDTAAYKASLNAALDYLDMLNTLDLSAVEPAAHVLSLQNILREDKLTPGLTKEQALANAPDEEEGTFVVPRIV